MWSESGPCYIAAEVGSNHDGNLDRAIDLVHVAGDASCDAVKFQCIPPFERDWVPTLQDYAYQRGLDFLATPFDFEGVYTLAEAGVPAIKIASAELVNTELVEAAADTGLPLILSTGMATLAEVGTAVRAAAGVELALLQCTTKYPTPYDQVNLRAMETLRGEFKVPVGLSDHTLGTAVPIAAAALGARIIEKHFTIDCNLDGPDHHYALEPDELRAMVSGIRAAEQALGDGRKGPVEGELLEARGRQLQWT